MAATITITCPQCKVQLRGPTELRGRKVRCKACANAFVIPANAGVATPDIPAASAKPAAAKPAAKAAVPAGKAASPAAPPPPKKEEAPPMYAFISDEEALAQMTEARSGRKDNAELKPSAARKFTDLNPYGLGEISTVPRCPHCAKEFPSPDAVICLHCGYHTQTRAHLGTKRTYENTGEDRFKWWLPGILGILICLALIGFALFLWITLPWLASGTNKDEWWTIFDGLWSRVWGTVGACFGIWFAGKLAIRRLILQPSPPELEKEFGDKG
jgi:hypothetical protein